MHDLANLVNYSERKQVHLSGAWKPLAPRPSSLPTPSSPDLSGRARRSGAGRGLPAHSHAVTSRFGEHFRVVGTALRLLRRPKRWSGSGCFLLDCWLLRFSPLRGGKRLPHRYLVSRAHAPCGPERWGCGWLGLGGLRGGQGPRVGPLPSSLPGGPRGRYPRMKSAGGGGRRWRPLPGGLWSSGRQPSGPGEGPQPKAGILVRWMSLRILILSNIRSAHSVSVSFLCCFAYLKSALNFQPAPSG